MEGENLICSQNQKKKNALIASAVGCAVKHDAAFAGKRVVRNRIVNWVRLSPMKRIWNGSKKSAGEKNPFP
jgi:hypothetical protein